MKIKRFSEYKKHGSPYLKPIQNIFKSGKFTYCLLVTLISLLLKALLLKAYFYNVKLILEPTALTLRS